MTSFKNNVSAFWNQFQANNKKINKLLREESTNNIVGELSIELDKVFNDIPFLIGGKDGDYELMLSPEGNKDKLFLARFWKEQAPQIPGWTFFHLKQRTEDLKFYLRLNDSDVAISPDDFFVLFTLNDEAKKFDIEFFCEKLAGLSEEKQWRYVYLMLVECLGEGYTETAIDQIDIALEKMPQMVPIGELYDIVTNTFAENEWTLCECPTEVITGYRLEPDENSDRYRDDIMAGYTYNINLINSYLQGRSESIDYMQSVGAEYVFLAYNHEHIPQEQKVVFRGEMEDALISFLSEHNLGYHLGGATGTINSYIDLLIFDITEFNKLIGGVLENFNIKAECIPFSIFVR